LPKALFTIWSQYQAMAWQRQLMSTPLVDTTQISDSASATRLRSPSGDFMSWYQIMKSAG